MFFHDMRRLERIQRLTMSLGDAWTFFSDPANLPVITPPELGFTMAGPLPPRMHPGMIASYTVTPFGLIRLGWITEITHVEEPHFFVDEQRFGPYRFWHHQHHMREVPGGVEMHDIVHYILPFAPFSRIIAGQVAKQLDTIFDFRHKTLQKMFSTTL
ncbi:SRPBCC family protein [Geomonas sp. RF6]|uniref:SRPBCC family protein n=1 Tax=Geomonas sp. RF6 TaxID=2897342 RepID=UPI001E582752|nr:SRPBCC family protein [Geomonas sp. RF6]UFS70992.1 SRPBCC family protein [Geomonas sp. RF6]